mgnify:CR=1 FL=1
MDCPCCSGKSYESCCAPVIRGQRKAASAEELMRSRYSAYALGEIDWVIVRQSSSGDATSGVVLNERVDRFNMGGRWVELPLAGVFEIKAGKIVLWRDYFDLPTFQKAMAG